MYQFVELPSEQLDVLADLLRRKGLAVACGTCLRGVTAASAFAEAKHRGNDSIRESQRGFLEAALGAGIDVASS